MKKISLALAAAGALSLGLASTAQAGEGGIAAGAAATFDANGTVRSLSVAAAVGKDAAAVAVRTRVAPPILTSTVNDTVLVGGNLVDDDQNPATPPILIGATSQIVTNTITTQGAVAEETTEAYALGGSSDITVNSIAASEALDAEGLAPNAVLAGGGDDNLGTAQANEIGSGTASFVVFDPVTGTVVLVEGNGIGPN